MNREMAQRYAKALFEAGPNQEQIGQELEQVVQLLESKTELKMAFFTVETTKQFKQEALQKTFQNRLQKQLLAFLFLLIDKGRFDHLLTINQEYQQLLTENIKGALKAKVTTVIPIDDAFRGLLKSKLEKKYQQPILLEEEIDSSLIGGAVILIGNQMIDYSLKTRLEKLKYSLMSTPV